MKFINKKGQLTTHYVALVILVITSLAIMFPVVRNSIYGFFKSFEESIDDSESDVNLKAPIVDNPGVCHCLDPAPKNCGGYDRPNFTLRCPIGYRHWFMPCPNCSPDQIKKFKIQQHSCRIDPGCCSDWEPLCKPPYITCCGANVRGFMPKPQNRPKFPPYDSCPDDYALSQRTCGVKASELECRANANCRFNCTGSPGLYAFECPNTRVRLLSNRSWELGPDDTICSGPEKCEAYCAPSCCAQGFYPCKANECY